MSDQKMFDGVQAYPLSWPSVWKRTPAAQRKLSQFADRSLAKAIDFMLDELRLLRAKNPVISTNVPLRKDGLPRSSGVGRINDVGVAVYFVLNGKPKVLACDKWMQVEDNLWAIGKHIESIRGQERWGVGTVDQAFMGYDALPAPKIAWWEILGLERTASLDQINDAYRQAAKKAHPDAGGSHEEFVNLQAAYNAALKEREH